MNASIAPLLAAVVRVDADRDGRAMVERGAGVDAEAGHEERGVGCQVRRREAERPAALVARDDRPLDLERAAEGGATPRTSPAATRWRISVDETPGTSGTVSVRRPRRRSTRGRRAARRRSGSRRRRRRARRRSGEVGTGEVVGLEPRELRRELDDERLLDAGVREQLEPALERGKKFDAGSRAPRAGADGR